MKRKIHKIKNRWKTFGKTSVIAGAGIIVLAWLIYKYVEAGFFYESFSNILGFGLTMIILGLIFVFFGKKLEQ